MFRTKVPSHRRAEAVSVTNDAAIISVNGLHFGGALFRASRCVTFGLVFVDDLQGQGTL
jgi:hypothetical protein